jgi:cell wall-associated NlpC family hydrolase
MLDAGTPGYSAQDPVVKAIRAKLVEGANLVLGKTSLRVNGKSFDLDCSGTVRAIYWYAGIDLARDFSRYSGNGVARLFSSLDAKQLLYNTRSPLSGDLVFWDNTYDMNRDGIWNDFLTHVGMVVGTAGDGTISYVHYHDKRGIVIEYMNLLEPATYQKTIWGKMVTLNSPLRLVEPGKTRPQLWLSGQLYRIMGMGYLF